MIVKKTTNKIILKKFVDSPIKFIVRENMSTHNFIEFTKAQLALLKTPTIYLLYRKYLFCFVEKISSFDSLNIIDFFFNNLHDVWSFQLGVTMREKKGGALQKLKKRLSHSFGRLCKFEFYPKYSLKLLSDVFTN